MKALLLLLFCWLFWMPMQAQEAEVPAFALWVECIERGIYPGRAVAYISYRYAGDTPITAEDSRFFGDTQTGETAVFDFRIMPGEHLNDTRLNVGAQKVVTWKVILFGRLHVVTAWDNPEIPDCAWIPTAVPTTETPDV